MGIGNRGLAAIDIDNHLAFHLEAVQTLNTDEQSLTGWYASVISAKKDSLKAISKYMVADTWFSKRTFVAPRKYAGKIIIDNIDKDYFRWISKDEESTVYSAELYSKALKRIIRLVYVI